MRTIRSRTEGRPSTTMSRAPCIYFNATPGNKIVETSIAQLASYVPSRREWKVWGQGRKTSIVCEKFVEDIGHDIVADHVTFLVDRDQNVNDAISRAVEVKEGCMREGRNFLSVKLHVGKDTATPVSKMSKWGANHLEINVAGLKANEVSDQMFEWVGTASSLPYSLAGPLPTCMFDFSISIAQSPIANVPMSTQRNPCIRAKSPSCCRSWRCRNNVAARLQAVRSTESKPLLSVTTSFRDQQRSIPTQWFSRKP
jgi:hypothetical protein